MLFCESFPPMNGFAPQTLLLESRWTLQECQTIVSAQTRLSMMNNWNLLIRCELLWFFLPVHCIVRSRFWIHLPDEANIASPAILMNVISAVTFKSAETVERRTYLKRTVELNVIKQRLWHRTRFPFFVLCERKNPRLLSFFWGWVKILMLQSFHLNRCNLRDVQSILFFSFRR